ncbi:MAG: peptidase dimerization domain-containing protein, partial [Candidatus Rokubacteria bacterium]|nr:peptidase dimerization domain-containing protein [Candidatus Rokubacteria bacterium]
RERHVPHGPVDVLFTICEESGLRGAKHFDTTRLAARTGIVLDCDGVNELITRAPAGEVLEITVHGLEAHSGIAPERGISAIQVAAEAIAGMRLGRVDDETTANLGIIQGGLAGNIIPNRVFIRGETRSHSVEKLEAQVKHMRGCFEAAAARHRVSVAGREHVARVEVNVRRSYEPLALADDSRMSD